MTMFESARVDQGQRTLAARYYTSPEIFQREVERIFYCRWVCVGRSAQVSTPGDYFLASIGDESLIILNDRSGKVGAFFNVCRHRGTRLCTEPSGHFERGIRCPYHAWAYGLDGQLVAAPGMDDVEGFCARDYPLVACALAEWEGFLWVNLAEAPTPFDQVFAPLIGRFSAWDLPRLRPGSHIAYQVQANWKLIFQNYSECYHCSPIHPQLSALSPPNSGRNDLISGPFLGGYMTLREGASLTTTGRSVRPPIGGLRGEDLRRAYYYTLMPNVLFSLHPDYAMVHTLWPEAVDRTRIVCEWYFEPEAMARPDFDPGDAVDFWDLTNRQDWQVSELTQLGVRSRACIPGPYAHMEGLLAAFDEEYLGWLG